MHQSVELPSVRKISPTNGNTFTVKFSTTDDVKSSVVLNRDKEDAVVY